MERKYEINDVRTKKDFSRISFSGYKRTEVESLLKKNILENKIEQAQYWCAELVCIGDFDKLWEVFFLLSSKNIHIANPRLFPYLHAKYNLYESIKSTGYHDYEIAMRNNNKIRECFSEIVCVLCLSPKMPVLTPLKMKKNELSILNLQGMLYAETTDHGRKFLKGDDPEELLISVNELAYLCFENTSQCINKLHNVIFWLHWILSYEEHCRINKMPFECATRQANDNSLTLSHKKDVVWIIWDIILESNLTTTLQESSRKTIHRILESLIFFYKKKFTHSCKKRKITLLYYAFQLLFMSPDMNIKLLSNDGRNVTETIKQNINIIYEKIKENEITPETDYLFDDIDNSSNNREKTQKRLEMMNSFIPLHTS